MYYFAKKILEMYDAPPEAINPEDDVGVAQTMPEQVRARGSVKKVLGPA